MRDTFFKTLEEMMSVEKKVVFITADLGFKLFDSMARRFPDRVLNVGIRESAMVGLAAGLSKEGFLPFLYSIAPFTTFRCLEQIRVDLCYNRLPAVIVGVGAGLAYGPNGPTHMGIDDIGVMSVLPHMTIVSPCDPCEVRTLLPGFTKLRGPVYLRLARNNDPDCCEGVRQRAKIFDPHVIRQGRDAVVFSYGAIVHDILRVTQELEKEGRGTVKVVSCHTLKPLCEEKIKDCLEGDAPVVVIEEHIAGGGLGSCVALILEQNGVRNKFLHLHLSDKYPDVCGDRIYLLQRDGLSRPHIKKALSALCNRERT
jgi:transketolase